MNLNSTVLLEAPLPQLSLVEDIDSSVLVTGFEPWGDSKVNPSQKVAEHFHGLVLPVDFLLVTQILLDAKIFEESKALILTGLDSDGSHMVIENCAWNQQAEEWEDKVSLIKYDAPRKIETSINSAEVCGRIEGTGIKAEHSDDPGSFLCNFIYFKFLLEFEVPAIFIHLPPLDQVSLVKQIKAIATVKSYLEEN